MLTFWLRAAAEMTRLGFDAPNVIALRTNQRALVRYRRVGPPILWRIDMGWLER